MAAARRDSPAPVAAAAAPTTTPCCTDRRSRPTTASPTRSCASTRLRIGRDAEAVVLLGVRGVAAHAARRVRLATIRGSRRAARRSAASSTPRCASRATASTTSSSSTSSRRSPSASATCSSARRRAGRRSSTPMCSRTTAKVGALALLADLAREYAAEKRRIGVLDFADQVAGALEIVAQASRASPTSCASSYRVVLLDEYQDTSVVQTDLLAALFARHRRHGRRRPAPVDLRLARRERRQPRRLPGGLRARHPRARSSRSRRAGATARGCWPPRTPCSRRWPRRRPVPVQALRPAPGRRPGEVELGFDDDLDAEADRVAEWFAGCAPSAAAAGAPTTGAILFRSKKHMVRLRRRARPARHPAPHPRARRAAVHARGRRRGRALRVISDPTAGSALIRLLAGPALGDRPARPARTRTLSRAASRGTTRRCSRSRPRSSSAIRGERRRRRAGRSSMPSTSSCATRPTTAGSPDSRPTRRERLREAAAVFARPAPGGRACRSPSWSGSIELELRLDIELAANEARGPARIASAQLRAFVDELHAFLAADETGSLVEPAGLARPRGAARRVRAAHRAARGRRRAAAHDPRLEGTGVGCRRRRASREGRAARAPRDTRGWLGFGVLPYAFRGDAPLAAGARVGAGRCADPAGSEGRDRRRSSPRTAPASCEEDRRLAYVAVTRARDHLLLTGSSWSGTKQAARAQRLLRRDRRRAGRRDSASTTPARTPTWASGACCSGRSTRSARARAAVTRAAAAVDAARAAPLPEPDPDAAPAARRARRPAPADRARPHRRGSRHRATRTSSPTTPARSRAIARPLPERPFRQTRLGTLFHAWVEQRSGRVGLGGSLDDALWEIDEDAPGTEASAEDAAALAALQRELPRARSGRTCGRSRSRPRSTSRPWGSTVARTS